MWEEVIKIIVGAGTGTFLCVYVAKLAIARSLRDLEAALATINSIKIQLAVISSKLHELDAVCDLVRDHDRKIASLEARRASRN